MMTTQPSSGRPARHPWHILRWGGIPLAIGGLLLTIYGVLNFPADAFSLIGLSAVYLVQRREAGRLGLAGFICAALALLIFALIDLMALPLFGLSPRSEYWMGMLALAATILFVLGYALLGNAMRRAGVFRPMTGEAMVLVAGLWVIFGLWGALIFGLYTVWLGYLLVTGTGLHLPGGVEVIEENHSSQPY